MKRANPRATHLANVKHRSWLVRIFIRFLRQPAALASAIFLAAIVLLALASPLLARFDPNEINLAIRLESPGSLHWLGTDDLGRDLLSRLLYASRISLLAPIQAVAVGLAIGGPLGLVAGLVGRWVDWVLGRVADALMSLPPIIFAIATIAVLGPSLTNAMLATGIVFAPRFFRIVRAATLEVNAETYVTAARAIGCTVPRLALRHIVPNILSPLLVQVSFFMGIALLVEASLSFLGLGVQPPRASWGLLLGRAFREINNAPHLMVFPGLLITATVLAFNFLGDGLRDALGSRRGNRG